MFCICPGAHATVSCLPSTQCASLYSPTRETSPIDTQVVAVDVVVVLAAIVRPSASEDAY